MLKRFPLLTQVARLVTISGLLVIVPASVKADQEGDVIPYTIETPDQQYVFVMLNSGSFDNPRTLHSDKYPKSGMYRNDGSAMPLWAVEWSAYVFLPSDGIHVIRKVRWARIGNYDEEAIAFFANGEMLKSYRVRDLVDFPSLLPRTSSHYQWQKPILVNDRPATSTLQLFGMGSIEFESGVVFDESSHTMKLATLQGDVYVFDIRTGEIISAHRPIRIAILVLGLFLLLIAFAVYFFRLRKRTARSHLSTK